MKILLTIHHHLDPNSGAPGVTWKLGQEYQKLGEAMACGLAPVTTTTPGLMEVVRDGDNGILVPPRDTRGDRASFGALNYRPPVPAKIAP